MEKLVVKVVKENGHAIVYLSHEEAIRLCKPGQGADTCIWAVVGDSGLECIYFSRPRDYVERWRRGDTTAKRDGCDEIRELQRNMIPRN